MALKGDLASVDLAQVFQMLSLNQKVGVLGIEAARASRALHFDLRGVTILYDAPAIDERVVMQAMRQGALSEAGLEDATAHSQRSGGTVLDSAIAGGYLTEEDIAAMTRVELEEDIYDIFFWRNAQFEFYEGAESLPTCADVRDERFYFSVDTVIMEAARRIDEWAFIHQRVQSSLDVFRARSVDGSALEHQDAVIFEATDGMRNVARLIDLTGMPRFQVFKSLAVLHEGGYIENVPDEELWEYARRCVEAERHHDALDLYERAIEEGADCSTIRAEVATVYETVEEFAKAAEHLKRVADSHVEADEIADAVGHLQHIVQMLPTDLQARERLVELAVALPEAERNGVDPSVDGKVLVDLYIEIGEIERVRRVLEQLLQVAPQDLTLKKRLINVHTKAGDTRRVVELYESIAQDLIARREPIEAVKYLQKVVMIDRSRRDISDRIRDLYEADERRRSRRRSLYALGGLLLVMTALGCGWYVYERFARSQMLVLETTLETLTNDEEFSQAIVKLDEFISTYPLTVVSHDASVEKARIESLRDAAEARAHVRAQQTERLRNEIRARYKEQWTQYEEALGGGRLDEALERIRSVQQLVSDAGAAEDASWAKRNSLERSRADLERYISESARIDREAWAKFERGEWRAARVDWIRVLEEFPMSATAKIIQLPIQLDSRPQGATIVNGNGEPLTRNINGIESAAVTPLVLRCKPGVSTRFQYQMTGFGALDVQVDPLELEAIAPALKVVPSRTFAFGEAVRAPVTTAGGLLVGGLRNGKFAIADLESGEVLAEKALRDLDDVRGAATFSVGRCFYLTTGGFIEARKLPGGDVLWRKRLAEDPLHDPVIHAGRLMVADRAGMLTLFDPATGRVQGRVSLGGGVAGGPAVQNGRAVFGTREGDIVSVDLANRKVASKVSRGAGGVATSLKPSSEGFIYGDDRGHLVLCRWRGASEVWQYDLDHSLADQDFCVSGDAVFARASRSSIVQLRLGDGKKVARIDLNQSIVAGPVANGKHVFVVVRVQRGRGREKIDVVKAFARDTLELSWEYEGDGRFAADPTCNSHCLFLPDSNGRVLLFR